MSNNLQLVIPKMLKSVGCGSKKKKRVELICQKTDTLYLLISTALF